MNRGLWIAGLVAAACLSRAGEKTALDRYVHEPDAHFSYELVRTIEGEGARAFVLDMTSQKWLTTNEVDHPLWKHWVTIIKPDKVSSEIGLLFITGGGNDRPSPDRVDQNMFKLAAATRSVVTELRMVPNQPLVFAGDGQRRVEDAMIAFTWDKYLRTGDEKWPARLPMTKSAVRAMDAVTGFCATNEAAKATVTKFVVAGASKRGWTTWTTGAVDDRVVAIVPIVIDLLNVVPSFQHHYAAYGFWAPAVGNYVEMGIMNWMGTPEFKSLMKIVEPYEYRDRYTMPKLMINSAGDQFFLPDSAQFYWNDLPGKKYIRYVPNSDHSLKNTDALNSLVSFHDAIIHDRPIPQYEWSFPSAGVIRVHTGAKPSKVKLWTATNPNARDFRLETLGPAYHDKEIEISADGNYEVRLEKPEKGWTAGFLELTYQREPAPFKFTSGVTVIPDVLPHEGEFVPNTPVRSR